MHALYLYVCAVILCVGYYLYSYDLFIYLLCFIPGVPDVAMGDRSSDKLQNAIYYAIDGDQVLMCIILELPFVSKARKEDKTIMVSFFIAIKIS